MNYLMIINTLATLLQFEGLFLIPPIITGIVYRDSETKVIIMVALASVLAGTLLKLIKVKNKKLHAKDGFVITALAWILLSAVGALPFVFTKAIPSFTDAFFETASGFTTTGASILTDIEGMCHSLLLWRSFTHWLGGMGVLVFIMAVVPSSADEMHIMKAESPGPAVDKLVPRVKQTAFIQYSLYLFLTVVEFIILAIGRMPIFDSICLTFGTAGTGGFGIRGDSVAGYSNFCQVVITVFMFLFGVNFKFYYLLLIKKFKEAFFSEEVRWYFIIYVSAVIMVLLGIINQVGNFLDSLRLSSFQVASVMTTTGYATIDFNNWATMPKTVMLIVMFIGACAGSTGGGMKVSRWIIYFKQVIRGIQQVIHPRSVKNIRLDGKVVDNEIIKTTNVYFMAYTLVFLASVIIVSIDGFDITSTFTSVVATINNIGPGLNMVGPAGNFEAFSKLSKWVLSFDMIAGRLEMFPMLILLAPSTWKRS